MKPWGSACSPHFASAIRVTSVGLPVTLAGHTVDVDAVLRAVTRDKKRVGDAPTPFVLVREPGDVEHGCDVTTDAIEASVRELLA